MEANNQAPAKESRGFGGWFRWAALLFTALMLLAVGYLVWSLVDMHEARLRVEDLRVDVNYNWDRAELQQAEYDAAEALIPEIRERLAALEPQLQQAQADNDAAREARSAAAEGYRNIRQASEAAMEEARAAEGELAQTREAWNALMARLGLSGEEAAQ